MTNEEFIKELMKRYRKRRLINWRRARLRIRLEKLLTQHAKK